MLLLATLPDGTRPLFLFDHPANNPHASRAPIAPLPVFPNLVPRCPLELCGLILSEP